MNTETVATNETEVLLDRSGEPISGIGRLDQVLGAKATEEFFQERDQRHQFLYAHAVARWTRGERPYRSRARRHKPRQAQD
ncbi:MAG: hypothetical protein U0520_03365 [Candidatus Saccharimonadales bacterium]